MTDPTIAAIRRILNIPDELDIVEHVQRVADELAERLSDIAPWPAGWRPDHDAGICSRYVSDEEDPIAWIDHVYSSPDANGRWHLIGWRWVILLNDSGTLAVGTTVSGALRAAADGEAELVRRGLVSAAGVAS